LIKGPTMAEVCLPTVPRTSAARVIGRLIGKWRARLSSARTIDPGALSDHMQRDLGFRDGRSKLTPVARTAGDLSALR
jgi:hypothetical protein